MSELQHDAAQRLTIERLERELVAMTTELTQAEGNYAIQKAAADEAEAQWRRTNAQYEAAARIVTKLTVELVHEVAQNNVAGQRLLKCQAELDEWKRRALLVTDDPDYQQCCTLREMYKIKDLTPPL